MKSSTILLGIVILFALLAGLAYSILPETVAIHWNLEGIADGFAPKECGVILFPILALGIYVLYRIIPTMDPSKNIQSFYEPLGRFMIAMELFFLYIFTLFLAYNQGYRFDFGQWLGPGFAVLLYSIGVLMAKSRRNYMIGFRTPWTLASERVWNETHSKLAQIFYAVSILPLFGFFTGGALIWIGFAFAFPVIYGIAYSFYLFRKYEKTSNEPTASTKRPPAKRTKTRRKV